MTTTIKPITLDAVGFPYHGLAIDKVLTTTGGNKTVNVTQGDVLLIDPPAASHPRPPPRSQEQASADAAKGYEWKSYALLCGINRSINGSELTCGENGWVYCDPGGNSWIVDVVTTKNIAAQEVTITVYLRKLIGKIGVGLYGVIDKNIGSITFRPSVLDNDGHPALDTVPASIEYVDKVFPPMPSPDGVKAFVCLHHYANDGVYWSLHFPSSGYYVMSEAVIVEISGIGAVEPATIGNGIIANLSISGTFTDFNQMNESYTVDGNIACGVSNTSRLTTRTVDNTLILMQLFDTSGAEKKIEYRETSEWIKTEYTDSNGDAFYSQSAYTEYDVTICNHVFNRRMDAITENDVPWNCYGNIYPEYGVQESAPSELTWIGAGAAGFIRQHLGGSSFEKAEIVSFWDQSSNTYNDGWLYYGFNSATATVHPVDGGLTSDPDGASEYCYV